jgi:hypothetical protein
VTGCVSLYRERRYDRIASAEKENWNGVRNGVWQGGLGMETSSVLYRYLDLNYNNEISSFPNPVGVNMENLHIFWYGIVHLVEF